MLQLDISGKEEPQLEWFKKFKVWYDDKFPNAQTPVMIQKEHSDDAYMHNIHDGLGLSSLSSSNMSQEEQVQQEEEKPKEMIVARNTIAA